jgi:hypothetical protein
MFRKREDGGPAIARGWIAWLACALLIAGVLAALPGCTRRFYRLRADKEVDAALAEKDKYPAWKIDAYHAYPDPRARFADPTDPDHPPMPPDDPAAWDLSPHPQKPGKDGVAMVGGTGYLDLLAAWDADNRAEKRAETNGQGASDGKASDATSDPGRTASSQPASGSGDGAASPTPPCGFIAPDPKRPFLIKLDQAVELGQFNSREFQDHRELLYLIALPVTLERFAFAAQFFALEQVIREYTGRTTPTGQHNDWQSNSTTGFSKLFSTGALLLFRVANQTVVDMSNPFRRTTSETTLSLDIVQPLLRGGGKAVTLEPLTQVERNLLYEIRDYMHFRRDFFVSIAGGGNFSTGTIVAPTPLVRAVLPPAPSVPGTVTPGILPGLGFRAGPIFPALPTTAGFLPTLLVRANLEMERKNVRALQDLLRLFGAIKEGGDVSQLQVDQVELQLLQGRSTVLQRELDYANFLDQLKVQVGVPTVLPLELDDAIVRPIERHFERYEAVLREFDLARDDASRNEIMEAVAGVRGQLRRIFTSSAIVQGTRFREDLPRRWQTWASLNDRQLTQRLRDLGDERRKLQARQTEAESEGKPFPETERQRLEELDTEIDLGGYEQLLRQYEGQPWRALADAALRQRQQLVQFRDLINTFTVVLGGARNERLDILRKSWPELPRLCLDGIDLLKVDGDQAQATVSQAALLNRLDLMNERALLVDSWRQIRVAANSLLGTFNIQYHLASNSPIGQAQPLNIGGSGNTHQLILNFELPFVRKAERNNYRSILMGYQRQRRALMADEDLVLEAVRSDIRQLRVLEENYKINQRAVELAYSQVENSLDTFRQPPTPASATAGGNTAANAAALTSQLLSAQSRLPFTQEQMLAVWVNYLVFRMQLYHDLELMPLDNRGVWIDDVATCECPPSITTGETSPQRDGNERAPVERLPAPESLAPAPRPYLGPGH